MTKALLTNSLLALSLVAACGTTTDDADSTPKADAGTVVDAGAPAANPNLAAVGKWTMSGTTSSACAMNLGAGFVGTAVAGTTHEFTLTLGNKFNGFDVILHCELTEGTKFTCKDYVVGMPLGGCNVSGGIKTISGHINGTAADILGSVQTIGVGTCTPTVNCGPREASVTGTIGPT